MAVRSGGSGSPGGDRSRDDGWSGRRPRRMGARLNALFVAPVPLVLFAFGKDPVGLGLNLLAFGVLMGAALMTREGIRAEMAYDARKIARRPALPRKIFGALLTGLGLGLAGAADPVAGGIFAVLGVALHLMAFGADPLRDKGHDDVDAFQADRVSRAVDGAEARLAAMRDAILRTGDPVLISRVERFATTARRLFRRVETDPRDLSSARRWLSVYLQGAADATGAFVDLDRRDGAARRDYLTLLDDLEDGFAKRTETMLLDDRGDLDIEIKVLRDRLARERLIDDRDILKRGI